MRGQRSNMGLTITSLQLNEYLKNIFKIFKKIKTWVYLQYCLRYDKLTLTSTGHTLMTFDLYTLNDNTPLQRQLCLGRPTGGTNTATGCHFPAEKHHIQTVGRPQDTGTPSYICQRNKTLFLFLGKMTKRSFLMLLRSCWLHQNVTLK